MLYKSAAMKKIASQMKAKKKIQNDIKTEVESSTPKAILTLDNIDIDVEAHKKSKKMIKYDSN